MDRRRLRGEVRRAAYAEACALLVTTTPATPEAAADDAGLLRLYLEERRRLLEWLRQRGRGELVPPPGGIQPASARKHRRKSKA